MTETGIDYVHGDGEVTFSTSKKTERDAIVRRLERYGHDYEREDHEIDGEWSSTLFTVPSSAVRLPRMLIKASRT